jgi:hypothetical protein
VTTVRVYAPLYTSVVDVDGSVITSTGRDVQQSNYIIAAIRSGRLVLRDPLLSSNPGVPTPPPEQLPPVPFQPPPPVPVNIPPAVTAKPIPDTYYVDPNDFGVRPSNVHWLNNMGLRAMRSHCLSTAPDAHWIITFGKRGTYKYSFNKWLCGFLDYTVDLGGGTLSYHFPKGETDPDFGGSYSFNTDTASFLVHCDFTYVFGETGSGINWFQNGSYTYHKGWKIATVDAGTFTVDVTDGLADLPYLMPGDPVFIGGWDPAFSSYPAPFQFFEYNEIQSITGTRVTLRNRTRNAYRASWPYRVYGGINPPLGEPRIYQLRGRSRNPAYAAFRYPDVPRNGCIRNGYIQGSWDYPDIDGFAAPHFFTAAYRSLLFENLEVDAVWQVQNCESVTFRSCRMRGYIQSHNAGRTIEIDKNCVSVSFENCTLPMIAGAQNCESVSFRDCIIERSITTQAQHTTIDNCSVGTSTEGMPAVLQQYRTTLRNVRPRVEPNAGWIRCREFVNVSGQPFAIETLSADKAQVTFSTAGGHSVFSPPNNFPFNHGDYLMKVDGSLYGKVVDAIHPATYVIRWSGTPRVGDQFYSYSDWNFVWDAQTADGLWPGSMPSARGGSLTLKSKNASNWSISPFHVPSKILSLVVNVTKAGTAGAFLWVRVFNDDGGQTLAYVDCTTTGTRTITATGVTGGAPGDFPGGHAGGWANLATWRPRLRFDSAAGPSPRDWPAYTFTINCEQLAF